MRIAIFGSDARAQALGRLLADAKNEVNFGDSAGGELLIFAGPRDQMDELLSQAGGISPETIVIDAMEGSLMDAHSDPIMLARKLDSRRVVRISIPLPQLGACVLYCGDDADAMTKVEEVFRGAGCVTTDRGHLSNSAAIEAPPNPSAEPSFETLKSANAVGATTS